MARPHKSYTAEFKVQAVRLVTDHKVRAPYSARPGWGVLVEDEPRPTAGPASAATNRGNGPAAGQRQLSREQSRPSIDHKCSVRKH